jgi:hypothetical protein
MPATYHDVLKWGAVAEMAPRARLVDSRRAKQEFRERVSEMEEELGVAQRQSVARSCARTSGTF